MKKQSEASILMWDQICECDWLAERELQFASPRRWRFDYAFPRQKVAVEIDGGNWIYGRHNTGSGKEKDDEKLNHATLMGWRILKFSPQQVLNGDAIAFIKKVLES